MILISKTSQIKISRETKDLAMEDSLRIKWKALDTITIDTIPFRIMTNTSEKYIFFKEIKIDDSQTKLKCYKCGMLNMSKIRLNESYILTDERRAKLEREIKEQVK